MKRQQQKFWDREDVNSVTEVERNKNEIIVGRKANIVEEDMDGVMPENLMKNKTQRDEKSSDESEDDYCMNGNNDEEATIVTMYKSHNGTVWSRSSPNSLRGRRCVENIVCVQVGVTRFLNSVDTSTDIF